MPTASPPASRRPPMPTASIVSWGCDRGPMAWPDGHPKGYLDGINSPGTAGGTAPHPGDTIMNAVLTPGLDAEDYDFGELLPASISGQVHARHGNACDV